jgi:type IV pilus assembly protein PilE
MTQRTILGFTLIELMIVMVIVGILLAIAIPSFNNQVRKSRRSDAISKLEGAALLEERWRADHTAYAAANATVALPAAGTDAYYTFTVPTATGTAYTLRAVTKGKQIGDHSGATACDTLELAKAAGAQQLTKGPAGSEACWR